MHQGQSTVQQSYQNYSCKRHKHGMLGDSCLCKCGGSRNRPFNQYSFSQPWQMSTFASRLWEHWKWYPKLLQPHITVPPQVQAMETTEGGANQGPERFPPPARSLEISFPPQEENIPKLDAWLKNAFAARPFNAETQPIPNLERPKIRINLKPVAVLKTTHTPIAVPFHWKTAVKSQLDRDVTMGIIEPVPEGARSRCCSRMVVTQKRDGTPRRMVDLQNLNRECLHETYHTIYTSSAGVIFNVTKFKFAK